MPVPILSRVKASSTDVSSEYDVIVLGAGSPGDHCADAPAGSGLRVAVVEREPS